MEKNESNKKEKNIKLNENGIALLKCYSKIYYKARIKWFKKISDSIINRDKSSFNIKNLIKQHKSYINGSLKSLHNIETPVSIQFIVNMCIGVTLFVKPLTNFVNRKFIDYHFSNIEVDLISLSSRIAASIILVMLLHKLLALVLNIVFSSIMLSFLYIINFLLKILRKIRHNVSDHIDDTNKNLNKYFKSGTALKFGIIIINNIAYLCLGNILIALSGLLEAGISGLGLIVAKTLDIIIGVPQRLISRILAVNGKIPTKSIMLNRSIFRNISKEKGLYKKPGVQGLSSEKIVNKANGKTKKRFFDRIINAIENFATKIGKTLDKITEKLKPSIIRNKGDFSSLDRLGGKGSQAKKENLTFSGKEKQNEIDSIPQSRGNSIESPQNNKLESQNRFLETQVLKPGIDHTTINSNLKPTISNINNNHNRLIPDNIPRANIPPRQEPIAHGTNLFMPSLQNNVLNNSNNLNQQDISNQDKTNSMEIANFLSGKGRLDIDGDGMVGDIIPLETAKAFREARNKALTQDVTPEPRKVDGRTSENTRKTSDTNTQSIKKQQQPTGQPKRETASERLQKIKKEREIQKQIGQEQSHLVSNIQDTTRQNNINRQNVSRKNKTRSIV